MKQTTDKSQLHWLSRCRLGTCEQVRVKCPVCKKFGHVTTHIMSGIIGRVQIAIQHSHFVEEQDAGRNIYCDTECLEDVPMSQRVTTWRLTYDGEKRLRDEYSEIWKK